MQNSVTLRLSEAGNIINLCKNIVERSLAAAEKMTGSQT
jgi:hypothetical protein